MVTKYALIRIRYLWYFKNITVVIEPIINKITTSAAMRPEWVFGKGSPTKHERKNGLRCRSAIKGILN